MDRRFKIVIGSIILVFLIFVVWSTVDRSSEKRYTKVCNDLTWFEPLEEKENAIEKELEEIYKHDIWVNCDNDYINEDSNIFWSKKGNMIDCRMMCSAYHSTEYYYTPINFWFDVNYQEYLDYKGEK